MGLDVAQVPIGAQVLHRHGMHQAEQVRQLRPKPATRSSVMICSAGSQEILKHESLSEAGHNVSGKRVRTWSRFKLITIMRQALQPGMEFHRRAHCRHAGA